MQVRPKLLKKLKIAMVLCFVGSILVSILGSMEFLEFQKLKNNGIETLGSFYEDRSLNTGKNRTARNVVIDYSPENSAPYRKLFNVNESVYNQLLDKKEIKITYLKNKPQVSIAGEIDKYDYEKFAMAVGLLLVSILIWLYFRKLHSRIDKEIGLK